jgi:hypothetical protein
VQRPRTVMPGPHRDAQFVQHLPDVVRVHAIDLERDRAAAVLGAVRPENPDPGKIPQQVKRVRRERLLVRGDVVHAER